MPKKRKLPDWFGYLPEPKSTKEEEKLPDQINWSQEPTTEDGDPLFKDSISGTVINRIFRKQYIQPILKVISEEKKSTRLNTNQIMHKVIVKGKVKYPTVFKPSVIKELMEQENKKYMYRGYIFHCGSNFLKELHLDDNKYDEAWLNTCKNKVNQSKKSSKVCFEKQAEDRKFIREMSSNKFYQLL